MLKHEDTYYLFGTAGRNGFLCRTSPNLIDWFPAGYALRATDQSWGRGSYWAPEVFGYRGKFYMAYSARRDPDQGFRLCLAVSDGPAGPYADLHAPWFDVGWATIDADPFVDRDGTPYIYFTKVGTEPNPPGSSQDRHLYGVTYGARLKDDLSGLDGDPVLCVRADQPWEQVEKDHVLCNEGPYVFRISDPGRDRSAGDPDEDGPVPADAQGGRDAYYMTYSSGHYASPAYSIGYATAPAPLGPWTKSPSNPLVATDLSIGLSGPGHSSITTSPDGSELFLVYHSHRDADRPGAGRLLNIDRLQIGPDGELKLIGPTRTPQPYPGGARALAPSELPPPEPERHYRRQPPGGP